MHQRLSERFHLYSLSPNGFVFTLRSLLHYLYYTLMWEDDDVAL